MRRLGTNLFIERRRRADVLFVVVFVVGFLVITGAAQFDSDFSPTVRGQLYGSLAATAGALLGFTLAALAILVALPSGDRMEILRAHHSWQRVPGSYFRAAAGLLAAVIVCTLGIGVDAAVQPWVFWEVVSIAILAYALSRVIGAMFALDAVLQVSQQRQPVASGHVDDPGP
jgi:hypothetical protein